MRIPINWLSDYLDLGRRTLRELADSFTTLGLMLDKPIEGNVLELEQRLNRSDLLSVIGCARELSAFSNLKLKEPKISLHPTKPAAKDKRIKLIVTTPTVRRFTTRIFTGLKVKDSPKWLRERLEAYGIESINNLVDITNFVMLEYGQTTHAQDLAKIVDQSLELRPSRKGEKITTLLGTEVTLPGGMYVISTGGKPCVIGGIVGGVETGVTNSTTDIILDAGNYDQRDIRQSSRKLKIINESVLRNDKFQDPRLTEIAINRATDLILELCGGQVFDNQDYYPRAVTPQSLGLTYSRLRQISGLEIAPREVKSRLKRLGFEITAQSDQGLELEVPYWRTDLEVEDDLVSDVLRIGNYNYLPTTALTTAVPAEITPPLYEFEDSLRDLMVSLGAYEHITSPLVQAVDHTKQLKLENSLSEQENALRQDLTETLSPLLTHYRKHNMTQVLLFEIGKSFTTNGSAPQELSQLSAVSTHDIRPALISLLQRLSISPRLSPAVNSVEIYAGRRRLGTLTAHSFTLDTQALMATHQPYQGVSTTFTPTTSLDLSLTLPAGMSFAKVEAALRRTSPSLKRLQLIEHYPAKNSLLIRLSWNRLNNPDQTRAKLVKSLKAMGVGSRSG